MAIELHHLHPGHDDEVSRLKERIAELEKLNHDLCERVTENDEIRLHWEEIEQTRAENERMKARIAELKQKLEDAGMRERRLRRALYKALANWAHFAVAFFSSFKTKDKWHKMEHKCLKKAEEYK